MAMVPFLTPPAKSAIDRIVDEQDCIELLMTYANGQDSKVQ